MTKKSATGVLELVIEFLDVFGVLCQKVQLYGRQHPRTEGSWSQFTKLLLQLRTFLPPPRDLLVIAYQDKRFYFENVTLLTQSPYQAHLIRECLHRNGMGGFVISLSLGEKALQTVLDHITAVSAKKSGQESVELPEGFRWVTVAEIHDLQSTIGKTLGGGNPSPLNSKDFPLDEELYREARGVLAGFLEQSVSGDGDLDPVVDVVRRLVEASLERHQEILPFVTIPYYREFTIYHSVNVCLMCSAAAARIVQSKELLVRIALAALLHDLGEAFVSKEILYKGERLTAEEAKLNSAHPLKGAEVLLQTRGIHSVVIAAAFGHHVKEAGVGYPDLRTDYQPGPITELVEVADIFEALTAFRPYKRPISAPQAFAYLYSEPHLKARRRCVDLLAAAIGFHPCGSRVYTQDGQTAIVCGHEDSDPFRPIVRLVQLKPGEGFRLGEEQVAGCGDLPWCRPSKSTQTVITALNMETDLDFLGTTTLLSALREEFVNASQEPAAKASSGAGT